MLLKALLGQGKFSAYHAIKDEVTLESGDHKVLTTVVESWPPGQAEAVSWPRLQRPLCADTQIYLMSCRFVLLSRRWKGC
jgi:hypothetical protein